MYHCFDCKENDQSLLSTVLSVWLFHFERDPDAAPVLPPFLLESAPKAFGIPLSQVIANDRAFKRRQDALKESRRDCLDLEASVLRFRAEKRQFFNGSKPLGSSMSIPGGGLGSPSANSVAPAPDTPSKPLSPRPVDSTGRQRRVRLHCLCICLSFLFNTCQVIWDGH